MRFEQGNGEKKESDPLKRVLKALRARLEERASSKEAQVSDIFAESDTLTTRIHKTGEEV